MSGMMTGEAGQELPGPLSEDPLAPAGAEDTLVQREPPEISTARKALVETWQNRVRADKERWKPAFERMREDRLFAAGVQWPGQTYGKPEDRYIANVVLRHVSQRTATLYAKNPRIVARRRQRLLSQVWDGSMTSVMAAQQAAAEAQMVGVPPPPEAVALLKDVQATQQQQRLLDRIGKTLELLFAYEISEQVHPFKAQMKATVRRAVTTGVGWVKLGFQRLMDKDPEAERQIADLSQQLANIERIAADIADGETETDSPDAETLRLQLQALEKQVDVILREGLAFDYPDSTAIIPHSACRQLRGFVGCEWVTEEFLLSPERVQEIYNVDIRKTFRAYAEGAGRDSASQALALMANSERTGGDGGEDPAKACVWVTYSRRDGLVYVTCDGYPDFLQEPAPPETKLERFWPWFGYILNECDLPDDVFPPSDVRLLRDMQLEVNRARQGLREHRRANRPTLVTRNGALDDEDKEKIEKRPDEGVPVLELNGLDQGQRVEDLLQALKMPGIDPGLYDTSQAMEDVLRVVGIQEANLGGTSGATATETSIAEGSRMSAVDAAMDDMDEMLTELARAGGQILLTNVSADTVKRVVGPGAVWPVLSAAEIAEELHLEVEAGSAGRPNQAREIQNMTQLMPVLLQVPGVSPEWLAKQLLTRMDERINLEDAYVAGIPSIQSMNDTSRRNPEAANAPPGRDPAAQGGRGASNARATPGQGGEGPRPPNPRPAPGAVPADAPLPN